jgi:hypothetical protein
MLGLRLCDGTFVPESEVSDFLITAVRQQLDSLRTVDMERDRHVKAVPPNRLPLSPRETSQTGKDKDSNDSHHA